MFPNLLNTGNSMSEYQCFIQMKSMPLVVFLMPIFLVNEFGIAPPYFCKWICPVGILEGAFPAIIHSETLRASLGVMFHWKAAILAVILISSIFIYRPFCKYLCPLGGFYGLL